MKNRLLMAAGLVVLCALAIHAASFVSVGTLSTVNNTTQNGSAYVLSTYGGSGSMSVQTGGLTATNAAAINDQLSVDGSNFVTVATYYLSSTNAGTQVFYPSFSLPIYRRAQVVTTNSVTIGVVYQ